MKEVDAEKISCSFTAPKKKREGWLDESKRARKNRQKAGRQAD